MTGDRELVDAVLAGDGEAFRVLVERELGPVVGICRRILGHRTDAEDAAQDALVEAYRGLATYRGTGSFGAWLTRIAIRAAWARRAARLADERFDGDSDEPLLTPIAAGVHGPQDPVGWVLDGERRSALIAAIGELPPPQRRAVALRFYGDLSLDEIAAATNRPIGTVKSRLHRGLDALREQLSTRSIP
jgi:RNA polymerase sigma-70 factor (ECF subfamily)